MARAENLRVFINRLGTAMVPDHGPQLALRHGSFTRKPLPLITQILPEPQTEAENPENGAEARMRQALGKLGTAKAGKPEAPRRNTFQSTPGARRHRFKQDGEVPVARLTLGETGRRVSRQLHAPVESLAAGTRLDQAGVGRDQCGGESARQVQELTDQLRATQTRLGHAELAAGEALRTAQTWQDEAVRLRHSLDSAETTLTQMRAELAASKQAREALECRRDATRHPDLGNHASEDTANRRKVGRPLGSIKRNRDHTFGTEPKPVKWWAGD